LKRNRIWSLFQVNKWILITWYHPSIRWNRGKFQVSPASTVQVKIVLDFFGRFLPLSLYNDSKEWNWYAVSKYALVHKYVYRITKALIQWSSRLTISPTHQSLAFSLLEDTAVLLFHAWYKIFTVQETWYSFASQTYISEDVWGCNQKFPDRPPGARTANGTALYHGVELYRYFESQSSEFYRHDPLCCFRSGVYCCNRIFRYRLNPETFGYTLVHGSLLIFLYGKDWIWRVFCSDTRENKRIRCKIYFIKVNG
jgi:hypothetical protein